MNWRAAIKSLIPSSFLNATLLRLPFLYKTSLVNYESNMGQDGLRDLEECLAKAVEVPGDVIECGSSRCGTSIILALRFLEMGVTKTIYACDSFKGFDLNELRKERSLGWATDQDDTFTSTSYAYVSKKLEILGVQGIVRPIPGYFRETLPGMSGPFCFALIDCDLRDSMGFCARCLFERLSPGAWMAFDDYNSAELHGPRIAVDEFVAEYQARLTNSGLRRQLYLVQKRF